MAAQMTKRERVERTLASQETDNSCRLENLLAMHEVAMERR